MAKQAQYIFRHLLLLQLQPVYTLSLGGLPFSGWCVPVEKYLVTSYECTCLSSVYLFFRCGVSSCVCSRSDPPESSEETSRDPFFD